MYRRSRECIAVAPRHFAVFHRSTNHTYRLRFQIDSFLHSEFFLLFLLFSIVDNFFPEMTTVKETLPERSRIDRYVRAIPDWFEIISSIPHFFFFFPAGRRFLPKITIVKEKRCYWIRRFQLMIFFILKKFFFFLVIENFSRETRK